MTMNNEEVIPRNDTDDDVNDDGNDNVGGEVAVTEKFNKLMGKQEDEERDSDTRSDDDADNDFLSSLRGDGDENDDSSWGSISDDEVEEELVDLLEAEDKLTG